MTTAAGKDMLVKEVAFHHLRWVREKRSHQTFLLRQRYVCNFVKFVGDRMVSEVTLDDLERFHEQAKRPNRKGNHALREVKTMFRWAERNDVCRCPVPRFPELGEQKPGTRAFTDGEVRRLMEVAGPDLRDLVEFAVMTGLRPGELRTLGPQHVKDNGAGTYVVFERHKTSRMTREQVARSVPLTPRAAEIVRRRIAGRPRSGVLFPNADGRPYTHGTLRRRIRRLCERAGVPPRPPYAFRHYVGTWLAAEGTNQAILMHLLGHSQISTTARYVSNVDEAHRKAVQKMQGILDGLGPVGE